MQKLRFRSAAFAVASAVIIFAAPASAQNLQSFVSGSGSDSNSCTSATAPCKTLGAALSKTIINGEINCADSGSTDLDITIAKSVTIDCPAGFLTLSGSVTIDIPAGNPSDTRRTVVLRGITFLGASTYTSGIRIFTAAAVILDKAHVHGFTNQGILDQRSGGGTQLHITNSTVENNGGAGIVAAAGATNAVVLDNVQSVKNTYGLAAATGNNVSVNRSLFAGNSIAGIEGDPGAQISVEGSRVTNNNVGIQSNASIRLSNSDISFNNTGVTGAAGSFGNNRFSGNVADGTPLSPLGSASSAVAQR
jgi:parallel beta helix pectate lyase-like protein